MASAILNAQDELNDALEALEALPVVEGQPRAPSGPQHPELLDRRHRQPLSARARPGRRPPGAVAREVTDALRHPRARHPAHGRRCPVARQRRQRHPGALDLGGPRRRPRPGAPGGLLPVPGRPQGDPHRAGGPARGAAPGVGGPRRRRRHPGESPQQRREVQPPAAGWWCDCAATATPWSSPWPTTGRG